MKYLQNINSVQDGKIGTKMEVTDIKATNNLVIKPAIPRS